MPVDSVRGINGLIEVPVDFVRQSVESTEPLTIRAAVPVVLFRCVFGWKICLLELIIRVNNLWRLLTHIEYTYPKFFQFLTEMIISIIPRRTKMVF